MFQHCEAMGMGGDENREQGLYVSPVEFLCIVRS
jgi:hypothetical protein